MCPEKRIVQAIESYPNVEPILQGMPPQKAAAFARRLMRVRGPVKEVFDVLLGLEDAEMARRKIDTIDQPKKIFLRGMGRKVVTLMAKQPDTYSFQFAMITSQIPFRKLPGKVQEKLNPRYRRGKDQVKLASQDYFLCNDAEGFMIDSVKASEVVLVNDSFLVKKRGYKAAICIKTHTTKNGHTFVEGNWYQASRDRDIREIKDALQRGDKRLHLKKCRWLLIRGVGGIGGLHKSKMNRKQDTMHAAEQAYKQLAC